jgi:hypothetical protein
MKDLSLHIHDIIENSLSSGADKIRVRIDEDIKNDLLLIEVGDNGKGMDEDMLKNVLDPFYTTRTTRRVGLGIPLLAQAAKECNGDMKITAEKGKGTTITATFQYSHIDRKPLGDIERTLIVIIATNPDIHFIFEHTKNNSSYVLDTDEIKKKLGGLPINSPKAIKIIKNDISIWLNNIKHVIKYRI